MSTDIANPLSPEEQRQWNLECKGLKNTAVSFADHLQHLRRIKDAKLYRGAFTTWQRFFDEFETPLLAERGIPGSRSRVDGLLEDLTFTSEVTAEVAKRIPADGGTNSQELGKIVGLTSGAKKILGPIPKAERAAVVAEAYVAAEGPPDEAQLEIVVQKRLGGAAETAEEPAEEVIYKDGLKVAVPEDSLTVWFWRTDKDDEKALPSLVKRIRALKREANAIKDNPAALEFPVGALHAALDRADKIASPFLKSFVCDCSDVEEGEVCPLCHGLKLMPGTCLDKRTVLTDDMAKLAEFGDPDADNPRLPRDEGWRRKIAYWTGKWARRKKRTKAEAKPPEQEF